jgi:hypothetical protein
LRPGALTDRFQAEEAPVTIISRSRKPDEAVQAVLRKSTARSLDRRL